MAKESNGVKAFVVDLKVLKVERCLTFDTKTGKGIPETVKTPVREIMIGWLYHRGLNLTYNEGGLEARRVCELIQDAKGNTVALNEDQYARLKNAATSAPGLTFHEMPIVDRVLNAKETTLKTG